MEGMGLDLRTGFTGPRRMGRHAYTHLQPSPGPVHALREFAPGAVHPPRRCALQITALGHSCILLDLLTPENGQHTRILVAPWLTDHATGDGMGRFPRARFEVDALAPIDAVFISHAHSDHLDPYTLVRLWQELVRPPVLLLPVTLAFLKPVFEAHLDGCDIRLLAPHQAMPFQGVELFGFYDIGMAPTNEDDVMVLVVRCGAEVVLVEADADLSLDDPQMRSFLTYLLAGPGTESAVFLTTQNELTGTVLSKDCPSLDARGELAEHAMNELLDAVQALYTPADDPDDLWQCPHLLRLIHGQGLTAPHALDPRWQHILFPVRIEHRVREEQATAARMGCRHRVDALTVGAVHTISAGQVLSTEALGGLELLDDEAGRRFDARLAFFPDLPCAPLRTDPRDIDRQRSRILALLDNRFLPFLHGGRAPSALHLFSAHGGSYRLRVHFGAKVEDGAWDYVVDFEHPRFVEVPPAEAEPQETYWANDLDDFLDGRCDEFSTFCRAPFPGASEQAIRLRACLATPLLNSDLVLKRVGLHFDRARSGQTPGSFVLPLYRRRGGGAAETP